MKTTFNWTVGIAIATLLSSWHSTHLNAQSDSDAPKFRPRTDANAKRDLDLLREVLNRASDVDGAINPLGNFELRNSSASQQDKSSRPDLGPSGTDTVANNRADSASDKEAEKNPTIEPRDRKQEPLAAPSKSTTSTSIEVLPGPRYTIIQQPRSQLTRNVNDDFRPALQYPVSLATSTIPWRGDSGNYLANFQDIPFNAPSPAVNTFPPAATGLPMNPQSIMPDLSNTVPRLSNPPQDYYQNQPGLNPGIGGSPLRSPSDTLPIYSPTAPMVNGFPFVSGAPCQFDARHMVSRDAYRQSVDPCAPTRTAPNNYAPYATQPGGSPYSYVPPTYMPYNNNGYDSGYRPVIGFGQSLANAYVGRGIVGQPTAYVDGQPVRNFIRYLFP